VTYDLVVDGLPTAWGEPPICARFKVEPADFIVREHLGFDLDGQGEHLFLLIRKCALNTHDVVDTLQRQFKCRSVDIGICGLKDKHAITDQWVSIRTPLNLSDTDLELNDESLQPHDKMEAGQLQILTATRHSRKLRRGAHQENQFIVRLQDVHAAQQTDIEEHADIQEKVSARLNTISSLGFPNYFGRQRFGFNQQNLAQAQRYFSNPRQKITRTKRGLYLSAARSAIFNRVCAHRVQTHSWNTPLNGEPMILDGAQSFFVHTERDTETIARCKSFDIQTSGPMWGKGEAIATADCAEFERDAMASLSSFCSGLATNNLKQQRRALRVRPSNLEWQWITRDCLVLRFGLPVGSYATSLLAELVSIEQHEHRIQDKRS
jgi:tRNA pseudouridine13 synthase